MKKTWIGIFIAIALVIIGVLVVTQNGTKSDEIKIGVSLPLTGDVASYGQSAKRGIEIALEEINIDGGIDGKNLEVVFGDDRNDPKEGVAIIKKFVTIDKVDAVIGSAGSTVTLAIAPLANQYEVILLSPISSSVMLTEEGGAYFFRVCPADDAQAKILAEWVIEDGYRKVALIYTNNAWGKPIAESFTDYFESKGGRIVVSEGVEEKSTDLRTQLLKIKTANISVVVSPTYPIEGGNMLKQAKEMAIEAQFYGGDNWNSPEFLTASGEAADGVYFVDPAKPSGEKFTIFAEKYQDKYGMEPDINAAFAYDALYALAEAMKNSKSLNGKILKDTLFTVSFEGASGRIEFDESGDLKKPTFDKKMIQDGKTISIK